MPPQFENNNLQPTKTEKHHPDPSILIILIIVMLLSGAGAIWYIFNLPPEPEPEIQPIVKTDQFADWQTYRNEEYGFEFKYPANEYNLEDLKNFSSNTLVSLYNIESKKISDECECGEVERFQVSHYKKDGLPIYDSDRDPVLKFDQGDNFFLVSNGNEDILSTFKFISTSTSSVDTSDWKIGGGDMFGFQLLIPPTAIEEIIPIPEQEPHGDYVVYNSEDKKPDYFRIRINSKGFETGLSDDWGDERIIFNNSEIIMNTLHSNGESLFVYVPEECKDKTKRCFAFYGTSTTGNGSDLLREVLKNFKQL